MLPFYKSGLFISLDWLQESITDRLSQEELFKQELNEFKGLIPSKQIEKLNFEKLRESCDYIEPIFRGFSSVEEMLTEWNSVLLEAGDGVADFIDNYSFESLALFSDSFSSLSDELSHCLSISRFPYQVVELGKQTEEDGYLSINSGISVVVIKADFWKSEANFTLEIGENVLYLYFEPISEALESEDSNFKVAIRCNSKYVTPYDLYPFAKSLSLLEYNADTKHWYGVPISKTLCPFMEKLNELGSTELSDKSKLTSNGSIITVAELGKESKTIYINSDTKIPQYNRGFLHKALYGKQASRVVVDAKELQKDCVLHDVEIYSVVIASDYHSRDNKPLFDGCRIHQVLLDANIEGPLFENCKIGRMRISHSCKRIIGMMKECEIIEGFTRGQESLFIGEDSFVDCVYTDNSSVTSKFVLQLGDKVSRLAFKGSHKLLTTYSRMKLKYFEID